VSVDIPDHPGGVDLVSPWHCHDSKVPSSGRPGSTVDQSGPDRAQGVQIDHFTEPPIHDL